MGEKGGFLKYKRVDPDYRNIMERLKDFNAVEIPLSKEEIRKQAARCMDCGTPFCHGYGCPLSNLIPEFNEYIFHGHWQDALEILLASNNFPEITGRICPALCEESCVLNLNREPVSIRQIELALVELGFAEGYLKPRIPQTRFNERVAVIGAGPAGLAAADMLNKAGFRVTVYDAARHPGGILRYGIPDFKLEKWIIQRRIDLMQAEGVHFEHDVLVGPDISFKYIKAHNAAICLACGAQIPRDIQVPGREFKGTYFAMDYLVQQNKLLGHEYVDLSAHISAKDKKVVILGGGDTGADCLGTALRQGAAHVQQLEILPKPPETRTEDMPWPSWPWILRRSSSHKEGGESRWNVTTKEILGREGKVTGLLCAEVEWSKGEKGMQMKEIPGTEFKVEADLVLLAMGFVGPGVNRLADDWGITRNARGFIERNKDCAVNIPGVFAAGDMTQGPSLVVRAIADGRKAAQSIIDYLKAGS